MANINPQFKDVEIIDTLSSERNNINLFYLTAWHTVTELHKTSDYIDQLRATTSKINTHLETYEKIRKSKSSHIENKDCKEIISKISDEYHYLIKTVEAMNQFLEQMEKTEGLNFEISGNMIDLKDQIYEIIKKINKILSF